MPQPYDYTLGNVPDPATSFMQGLQRGVGMQQLDVQRQQQQLAMQAEAQKQEQQRARAMAMQALMDNPSPTADDYRRAMTAAPDLSEDLKRGWEVLNTEQQQSALNDAGQVYAALESGKPEYAIKSLRDRVEAMKTGGANPMQIKAVEDMAALIEMDPATAKRSIGMRLATAPGGDKVMSALATMGGEQRNVAEAPAKLRKGEADATKAESDAVTAGVTAEFAKPMAIADLKKRAADTGLTQAQTNQAIVTTKKLNAEIQHAAIEAATGDPAKKFDFETKLRKEYTAQIGPAVDTQQAYERVNASQDNAVGDLSLIFGYMKMLDPGSVVREGEFATAQNAAGIPERVLNAYNKALTGERLGANQRKQFISQAKDLNDVAERRAKEVRESLMPAISAYKLDKNNIFGDATKAPEPPKPAPAPAPAAEQTATNPKTGERLVLRGGKWVPLK